MASDERKHEPTTKIVYDRPRMAGREVEVCRSCNDTWPCAAVRLTAEVERLTQELDNARALVLADQGVLVDAPALAVGERLRAERAEAERDALAAQGASLREALEAVKEIIGPAYAWAEIDRERDDTDWQACERAEKLMYAALAAGQGDGQG
jgi:hypothetical protein